MKKLTLFLILIITVFTSCKTSNSGTILTAAFVGSLKHKPKKNVKENPMPSLQIGCFIFADDESKISMEITEIGDEVKANLSYALFGKDRNEGTFVGVLKGDELFGTYTFLSEGIESSREVAFLVKGDQLIEGFGRLNKRGNRFKDKEAISYTSAMPLTKANGDK